MSDWAKVCHSECIPEMLDSQIFVDRIPSKKADQEKYKLKIWNLCIMMFRFGFNAGRKHKRKII